MNNRYRRENELIMPKVEDGKLSDLDHKNARIRQKQLLTSLRQWCKENGVKIRLTHDNHIVIQERKDWCPPQPHPEEKVLIQNLIFVDRGASVFEKAQTS